MKSFSFAILCVLTVFSNQLFSQSDSTDLKVFEKVDIDASFPGGQQAWIKFLQQNLKANVPVDNGAPAGKYTVWAQFIVDKEGNITDLKTLTNQGYGMEQEVLRILKLVPKWNPASQNGRNVKAYRKQPITFIVEIDGLSIELENPKEPIFAGEDRRITVTADKVKPKNMYVTISQGTITGTDGSYIIRPAKADKFLLTIYNKDKEVGQYCFFATTRKQDSTVRGLKAENKTDKIISSVPEDGSIRIMHEDDENKVWERLEVDPSFPGGEREWVKFLQRNLDPTVPLKHRAPDGKYTVWIQLIVDKYGHGQDWRPLTNIGYGMEDEAMRVIQKVELWVPGIQNGYKVKAYKKIPITFIIQ